MPLLDYFQPPLELEGSWHSFHARWASALSDWLNDRLPPDYFAEPEAQGSGPNEIDVATWDKPPANGAPAGNGAPVAVSSQTWAPPVAALVMPAVFPGHLGVKVFRKGGGAILTCAIELISESNKDLPDTRRAFAVECANYLYQGVGLVIVDVVTNRGGNLHDEIIRVMDQGNAYLFQPASALYAVAYRPLRREQIEQIEMWPAPLTLGGSLPVLPLWLRGDLCLPIDLETTYAETRRRLRIL